MMHAHTNPEHAFNTLSLKGSVKYTLQDQRVLIEIDEISNHANPGLLSGTLALELWALPTAYQGNDFSGFNLAATTIGELKSQHSLFDCHYDLIFREPPEGSWNLVLMLREWDGQAYMTRDYVNFALPYQQASKQIELPESKQSKVIHLAFDAATLNEAGIKSSTSSKDKLTGNVAKQLPHTSPEAKPALQKSVSKRAKPKTSTLQNQKGPELLVRINRASKTELAAIKGIYTRLADDIVSSQPFADLKTLQKVKGLGKKKLEALTQSLIK